MHSEYSDMDFYVRSTECGTDSLLAPYVLLSDLQETADKGSYDTGWGRNEIGEYNCCWIVLRYFIHIDRLPAWMENFTVRTWTTGAKKVFFDREYEIFDSKGERIGAATSVWILADKDTHMPVYPSKLTGLPEIANQRNGLMGLGFSAPKIKITPRDSHEGEPVIIKHADYTELDHNKHVNNTRYLAWIYDALYKAGKNISGVSDININYVSEVRPGSKVEIFVEDIDGGAEISGYKDGDEGVFVSRVKFCI